MTFISVSRLRGGICHSPPTPTPRCKIKQRGNIKGYIFKTKQSNTSRLESWRLLLEVLSELSLFLLLVLCFGTDGPATLKSSISGQRETVQNSSDWGRGCQSSHLIVHRHTGRTQTSCFMRTVQPKETKIDTKIDLIYSARTALLVLAAKTGQRDRQTKGTDRHLSADA